MSNAPRPVPLVLEDYFSQPIRAEGAFLNYWSRSRLGVTIDIVPTWDGKVLSLDELFVYGNGTDDHQMWRLEKTGPGTFLGTRADMIGTARVWTEGYAVRLKYVLLLAGMGFAFDETMIRYDDDTLVGRSTVKKWGIAIGRVELAMRPF